MSPNKPDLQLIVSLTNEVAQLQSALKESDAQLAENEIIIETMK